MTTLLTAPPLPAQAVVPRPGDEELILRDRQRLAAIPTVGPGLRGPLDALAVLARHTLAGREAWVTLLGGEEQRAIGCAADGPRRSAWPVREGLCLHTLAAGTPLLLGELRMDPVAALNPAVAAGFHAYAGAPVRVAGERVGALCVLDVRARAWTLGDAQRLAVLADLAGHLLETGG